MTSTCALQQRPQLAPATARSTNNGAVLLICYTLAMMLMPSAAAVVADAAQQLAASAVVVRLLSCYNAHPCTWCDCGATKVFPAAQPLLLVLLLLLLLQLLADLGLC